MRNFLVDFYVTYLHICLISVMYVTEVIKVTSYTKEY